MKTTKPIIPIRCKVVEFDPFISGGVYVGNMWGKANSKVTKSHYGWGIQSPKRYNDWRKSGYTLTELT